MALRKGWIGPLVQSKEGKRPWICDYCCPLTGKKKRKLIAPADTNKKKREALYHDFRHWLDDGTHVTKSNLTFNDALDAYEKWCEQRRSIDDRMSAGTLVRIRHAMKVHLRPELGKVKLKDMTTPMIETYLYTKAEQYKTMHFECYQVTKSALDRAVKLDMLSISPLDVKKIWLPPRHASTRTIPTIEEGRALWNALEREIETYRRIPYHSFANNMACTSLAMFGGMCAGEMAGLQWEDINFTEGYVSVEHSLSRYGGLKGPKVKDRHRLVPLSPEMNKWLGVVAEISGHSRTGYTFRHDPKMRNSRWLSQEGTHNLRGMTARLQHAQIRLGFVTDNGKARWTMHELRHYAGSVWLELGHPLESVSRMLGHGKTDTTKKYYIHFFKKQTLERDRAILAKMSELHQPLPRRDSCEILSQASDHKALVTLGGRSRKDD